MPMRPNASVMILAKPNPELDGGEDSGICIWEKKR